MTKHNTTPASSASRHLPWVFNGQSLLDAKGNNAATKSNGPLIASCVNALAGMNPEAEPLMIEALKAARTCLEIDCAITPTERGAIQGPSDALALVNAALKGSK